MIEIRSFSFEGPHGQLHGIANLPEQDGPRPVIVDCHGFKGFMEWGFHPYLADLLAQRGCAVVRFNFRSSGMQPGDDLVSDERAFATTTVSADLEDLVAVLRSLDEILPGRANGDRIGLLGHSRGGGLALLAAAHDEWRDRISALVTWSAVSSFDRLSAEDKDAWRAQGSVPVVNARTGQELALDQAVLEDLEANAEALDLIAAAGRRTAPWLIVHGMEDETVPLGEAETLATAAREPLETTPVSGATHTFGAQHPFHGPTPHLVQAMNATQTWLRRYMD